jgi:hypothetical protein
MIIPVAMAYVGESVTEGKEGSTMGMLTRIFYIKNDAIKMVLLITLTPNHLGNI